jgi:dihydrofolate reductase
MRKLTSFMNVSLDGYFADSNGDMSWAKHDDREFREFVADNAKRGGVLLFGRTTYELMASYWPTPLAARNDPMLAERMNNLPKIVFSRTLDKASWNNTMLVKGDMPAHVRKMKNESGDDMVVLGSGSIMSQLAQAGLIDELQFVINPIVLGGGSAVFVGIKAKLNLKLAKSRAFHNGNVFLCYEPVL